LTSSDENYHALILFHKSQRTIDSHSETLRLMDVLYMMFERKSQKYIYQFSNFLERRPVVSKHFCPGETKLFHSNSRAEYKLPLQNKRISNRGCYSKYILRMMIFLFRS